MTVRRRFFPSTPAQQQPGQHVELEMQLRPEAPPEQAPPTSASGDCECDVIGAGWLVSMTAHGADMGWQELPDGRWEISGYSVSAGSLTSYWEGVPETFSDWGMPLEGPTFRCKRLELYSYASPAAVIVGVLQGRTLCGARWHLAWDRQAAADSNSAQSINGHVARAEGNMVWVYQFLIPTGAAPNGQAEVLTAKAMCGGVKVAELVLEITPY